MASGEHFDILNVMAAAIEKANINDPVVEPGISRDAQYLSSEQSEHLALAVLRALDLNGYHIVPEDEDDDDAA